MALKNFFKKKNEISTEKIACEWLEVNKNSYKLSTYQTYKRIIEKHISKAPFYQKSIQKIEHLEISDFTNVLIKKGLSPKSVNNILIVLNMLFKYSNQNYETKLISITLVKECKKEMKVLSLNEQQKFEKYLKKDIDIFKFAALFSLYTGLRIGEICALKWEDVNENTISVNKTMLRLYDDNGKSHVVLDTPKTANSTRIIPIPNSLKYYIELYRKDNNSYVLSTSVLKKIEPRLLQIKFKTIAHECNLENITFHTLRHTFATRCVECGVDIKTLSEILGHADVQITLNKYVHSSMELKISSMERLSQILT